MAAHTLARKGSSAYEKSVREGRAVAIKSRTPEPEEAEEEEEGEEEELDMAMGSPSRKRSAKGAKNTKPAKDGYGMKKPMDAEGCSGGPSCMSKGRKGKCDGSCGKAMKDGMCGAVKKMDSLTPQEYLAACDLGIQNRSRPYIRARLDAAVERLDLKCGKGSISEGEKCSKGPATKRAPRAGTKETLYKKAGMAGAAASAGYAIGSLATGNLTGAMGGVSALNASSALYNRGAAIGYTRTGQKSKAKLANLAVGINLGYAAVGAGAAAQLGKRSARNVAGSTSGSTSTGGTAGGNGPFGSGPGTGRSSRPPRSGYQGDPFKDLGVSSKASASELKTAWKKQMMVHHPDRGGNPETAKKINSAYQAILKARGIKDSIYADGFSPDLAQLAL